MAQATIDDVILRTAAAMVAATGVPVRMLGLNLTVEQTQTVARHYKRIKRNEQKADTRRMLPVRFRLQSGRRNATFRRLQGSFRCGNDFYSLGSMERAGHDCAVSIKAYEHAHTMSCVGAARQIGTITVIEAQKRFDLYHSYSRNDSIRPVREPLSFDIVGFERSSSGNKISFERVNTNIVTRRYLDIPFEGKLRCLMVRSIETIGRDEYHAGFVDFHSNAVYDVVLRIGDEITPELLGMKK